MTRRLFVGATLKAQVFQSLPEQKAGDVGEVLVVGDKIGAILGRLSRNPDVVDGDRCSSAPEAVFDGPEDLRRFLCYVQNSYGRPAVEFIQRQLRCRMEQ